MSIQKNIQDKSGDTDQVKESKAKNQSDLDFGLVQLETYMERDIVLRRKEDLPGTRTE